MDKRDRSGRIDEEKQGEKEGERRKKDLKKKKKKRLEWVFCLVTKGESERLMREENLDSKTPDTEHFAINSIQESQ